MQEPIARRCRHGKQFCEFKTHRKACTHFVQYAICRPTIHYMREKERREFTKRLNEERSKVGSCAVRDIQRIRETKLNESKELEKRLAMRDRQMLRVEDKDKIRNLVIRYLGEREYLSLNELVDLINAPRVGSDGSIECSCIFRTS